MIVLGFDTATHATAVGLRLRDGRTLEARDDPDARAHPGHATRLLALAAELLAEAGLRWSALDRIAVGVGPGRFTGLRVGIATAKALAQTLRLPMIGVSSLDLLAFRVRYTNRLIVAVLDARRGEVFYAFYRQVPGGAQRLSDYTLGKPEDLAWELLAKGEECLVVGDGALRYPSVFAEVARTEFGEMGTAYPSAAALVELAHPQAIREEFVPSWELRPLYLRKADAEINWETRDRQKKAG